MSSICEASVELASQDTRAIQGVTAGNGHDKREVSDDRAEVDLGTDATCEVQFTEGHECASKFRFSGKAAV